MKSVSHLVLFLGLFLACGEACAPDGVTTVDKVGDDTYVCVVVNSKKTALFIPKADEYTRIVMGGSFNDNNATYAPMTISNGEGKCSAGGNFAAGDYSEACKYTMIHVESMGKRSMAKAYKVFNKDGEAARLVFPVLTAVISVKLGEVMGITWDDGCHFCQDSTTTCVSNIFTLPKNQKFNSTIKVTDDTLKSLKLDGEGKNCQVQAGNKYGENPRQENCLKTAADCDLKLYVVWTGTDKAGNYFTSASLRFSRFAQYSINDMYGSAKASTLSIASEVEAARTRL
jgi:hypothetical protein|eukprot:g7781.t1